MALWNPWRGCHRVSEGCRYCFIHEGDKKRKQETGLVVQTPNFYAPVKKVKGEYKMKSGQTVFVCFSSDFFIKEADEWREECWQMIKERSDLHFTFLTKRIERFLECIPADWGDGYENVTIGVSVENQQAADKRLPIFSHLPIKHKNIICQPLIGSIKLGDYLDFAEMVVTGGEYHTDARPLDYEWILSLREECLEKQVDFEFRQCGTHFIKEDKTFKLSYRQLFSQAKKADINVYF